MTSALILAAAAHLAFSVETVKSSYLIGEPIVLIVTQHGAARIFDDGWFGLGYPDSHFRILIDRGRGFERFRRKVLVASGIEPTLPTLIEDGRRQEFVLSYDEAIGDVVFPGPGEARIAVEYEDPVIGLVRSDAATVRIVEPEGAEREVYDRLRAMDGRGAQFYLELTSDEGAPTLSDDASRELVASYPSSVYVQGARARNLRANLRRTIPEAEALVRDLEGGQFEPAALVVLAMAYGQDAQYALADATWQRIEDAFPRRDAADIAREALASDEEDDEYEDEVDLLVRPARIAPGGRYVPVHVDVADSASARAGIALRLVEVKCHPRCDPESDVRGVTLGTDDRDAEVRAHDGASAYVFVYEVTHVDGARRTIGAVLQVGPVPEERTR